MEAMLAAKAKAAPGGAPAAANPHAEHGAAPAPGAGRPPRRNADAGKGVRVMHKELAALDRAGEGADTIRRSRC